MDNNRYSELLARENIIREATGCAYVTCTELGMDINEWFDYREWVTAQQGLAPDGAAPAQGVGSGDTRPAGEAQPLGG